MIVVDAGDDQVEALTAVAVPAGWTRRAGFDLPARPWDLGEERWVCCGVVADAEQGASALAALARGVGLVVRVEGPSSFRLQVLDDLHRNGTLVVAGRPARPALQLSGDDVTLLRALAEGATVDEAARLAMISPRTAHRRLALVRDGLGAANTTEAVALWSQRRSDR